MSSIEREFRSNLNNKILSELDIEIKARNEETLNRLTSDIAAISKGEVVKIHKKDITSLIKVKNESQADLAVRLALNTNHCFFIKPSEKGLIIEEVECPSCEEGAVSELPEKYFILKDGRVIEKRGNQTYLVYICKVRID